MLVKSFTDDLAWKVQRQLVNCYFRTKESVNIAIPELEPLTKVEWLKVCEYISSCPKHAYNALMIAVNEIAPKQFDFAEIRNESFGQGQNSDNFSKILRETLKNKKMSQNELSRRTGINKSSISQYVNDKHLPQAPAHMKICETLNIIL